MSSVVEVHGYADSWIDAMLRRQAARFSGARDLWSMVEERV